MKRLVGHKYNPAQVRVLGFQNTTPTATKGLRYIVGKIPTGTFAGHTNKIAWCFTEGTWEFDIPKAGWRAWVISENEEYIFDGDDWVRSKLYVDSENWEIEEREEEEINPDDIDKHFSVNLNAVEMSVVSHGLNKLPAVKAVNALGEDCMAKITHLDNNNVKVEFSSIFTGKLIFN